MASGRIVVGVDGSEGSEKALLWCVEYGTRLGFEIVAVHAVPMPVYAWVAPSSLGILDEKTKAELLTIVRDEWCAPLRDAGAKFDVLLVEGTASAMIMDVAEREDADMIVVGSRGHGGFGELLLGSTSHQLAHHSRRPLVIVPPDRN